MLHKRFIDKNARILFNGELLPSAPADLFERLGLLQAATPRLLQRGSVLFFTHNDMPMVLKHYHRGGLLSRLVADTYWRPAFPSNHQPRMWQEFTLLAKLRQWGLPVPEPVAARCLDTSPLTYRGDLITREIRNTRTLATRLSQTALSAAEWRSIGQTIARFHNLQVCHADLNARNVLLDDAGHSHLVDFDKSVIKPANHTQYWMQDNLARLRRSLNKLLCSDASTHYRDADWQHLLQGYETAGPLPVLELGAKRKSY